MFEEEYLNMFLRIALKNSVDGTAVISGVVSRVLPVQIGDTADLLIELDTKDAGEFIHVLVSNIAYTIAKYEAMPASLPINETKEGTGVKTIGPQSPEEYLKLMTKKQHAIKKDEEKIQGTATDSNIKTKPVVRTAEEVSEDIEVIEENDGT